MYNTMKFDSGLMNIVHQIAFTIMYFSEMVATLGALCLPVIFGRCGSAVRTLV